MCQYQHVNYHRETINISNNIETYKVSNLKSNQNSNVEKEIHCNKSSLTLSCIQLDLVGVPLTVVGNVCKCCEQPNRTLHCIRNGSDVT
jgi:hypothetical protein